MPSPEIDVLLLDADGVLQYLPPAWATQVMGHAQWPGTERLLEVEAPFLVGERREGFPQAVAQMLAEAGSPLTAEAFFEPWSDVHADPAALDLVRRVQEGGTPVHLATNQQWMRAQVMRDRALYDTLDGGYYSFEMGCKKPSWDYFDHIVRDLGVRRDRVLFVDDTLANVVGARAAGLRAVHKPYELGVPGLERVLRWHGVL